MSAPPFHPGESAVQERAGVREKVEARAGKGIRDFMPDQHREFFEQLEYFFVGGLDGEGRPWASVLDGEAGFLRAPDAKLLEVHAAPRSGDPLAASLNDGCHIGALGIQLHTRRRNRVNGVLTLLPAGGFALHVKQSFGNCPKYIQARQARRLARSPEAPRSISSLDDPARGMIARSDTFFIASRHLSDPSDGRQGIDVSHRGGRAGFVHADGDRSLVWPDYPGNNLFNTLGNIALDPRAGLLFIDFDSGDTLQLTGRAEIVWRKAEAASAAPTADRLVRFHVDEGWHTPGALPFAWDFLGYAPQFHPEEERHGGGLAGSS